MTASQMRQLVDWRAATWAAVGSSITMLLVTMALSALVLGSPWVYIRLMASLLLGGSILPPPATITSGIFLVGLLVHILLSSVFALLIAVIIHRWGMIVGIIGGGVLGLALYMINFFAAALIFPWVYNFRSWLMLAAHLVFGSVAGGLYEALEVERFVPKRSEAA